MIAPFTHKYPFANGEISFTLSGACPHCSLVMAPADIETTALGDAGDGQLYAIRILCSNAGCLKAYVSIQIVRKVSSALSVQYRAEPLLQYPAERPRRFGEEITRRQPRFVEAYAQATSILGQGMPELAALGYRRALELLAHDYATEAATPAQAALLDDPSTTLRQTIEQFFTAPSLQALAKQSAWLEDGILRPAQASDPLDSLLRIINACVAWVDMEYQAQAARQPQGTANTELSTNAPSDNVNKEELE